MPCFGGNVKRAACRVAKLPQVAARQAAEWLKRLAVRGAAHHNMIMKVLAWPLGAPWWRLLACLLVALAALAWMPDVFAQAAGAINTNFPYLGPDPQKAMSAYTIFGLQYKLFLAPLSGQGAVEGLYYLALLATMVGALLIVFNQKFRAPSTLGAWLILVVIMLFAPFNSRLLFYPMDRPAGSTFVDTRFSPNLNAAALTPAGSVAGCSAAKPCGFTPQLVGIHVASILHVAFSSLFSSDEWRGLVSNMRAEARARQDPALNVGESWLQTFAEFDQRQCSRDDLTGNTTVSPPARGAAVATPIPPVVTMGEMWAEYRRLYEPQTPTSIPPLMRLPNEASVLREWGRPEQAGTVIAYLSGVTELLKIVGGTNLDGRTVMLSSNPAIGSNIPLDTALNQIARSHLLTTSDLAMQISTSPGFFIAPEVTGNGRSTLTRQELRRCYSMNMENNVAAEARRNNIDCVSAGGANSPILFNPATHREHFLLIYQGLDRASGPISSELGSSWWMPFLRQYRANTVLEQMPIIRVPFGQSTIVAGIGNNRRFADPLTRGASCRDDAINLINAMFTRIRENLRSSGNAEVGYSQGLFNNLNQWALGTSQVPAQITVSGTTGLSEAAYPPSSRAGALNQFMASYFRDLLLDRARQEGLARGVAAFTPAELSENVRREVVVLGMIDVVRQATAGDRQRSEAERNAVSRLSPQLTGFGSSAVAAESRGESRNWWNVGDNIARAFSSLATILGQTAIWVVSWFYGLIWPLWDWWWPLRSYSWLD